MAIIQLTAGVETPTSSTLTVVFTQKSTLLALNSSVSKPFQLTDAGTFVT